MKLSFAIALLVPTAAMAAGPFDGTWKTQLDSIQFSDPAGRLYAQTGHV